MTQQRVAEQKAAPESSQQKMMSKVGGLAQVLAQGWALRWRLAPEFALGLVLVLAQSPKVLALAPV